MKERNIHQLFVFGVFLKGLNAVLEIIAGVLLLYTGTITGFITDLIQNELIENPTDFVATHIQSLLGYVSANASSFAVFYLLSHGIIKIFLVWGLLKNKLWAYPASLFVLFIFMLYQVIRYTVTHSLLLLLITLFDVFVLWLIWHEYQEVKQVKVR